MRAPHEVGDIVYVKTFAASGEQFFRAKVAAIRDQFPPIQVEYLSTLDGETDTLALPVPIKAFVSADQISTTQPAAPAPRRPGARVRG